MSERIEEYVNRVVRFLKLHPMVKDVNVERRVVTGNRGARANQTTPHTH